MTVLVLNERSGPFLVLSELRVRKGTLDAYNLAEGLIVADQQ